MSKTRGRSPDGEEAKTKILHMRVTEREDVLLDEMKSLLVEKGVLEDNTTSNFLRFLVFLQCRTIVGEINNAE